MNPSRIVLSALLLAGGATALYNCSTAKQQKAAFSSVAPPLIGVNTPLSSFEVDPAHGDTLIVPGGTRIIVPAGVLVDASGNPVKEKVKIDYREFHDAADIIASGIMMNYDSAGQHFNFESAGMFDISGKTPGGENVYIRKGAGIRVDLASFQGDENYNFYALDTVSKKWNYLTKTAVNENPAVTPLLDKEAPLPVKPVEPQPYDGKSLVFDFDVNYQNHPELEGYNGVVWQYTGNSNTRNPNDEQWVFNESWYDVDITCTNSAKSFYSLKLKNSKKEFETEVTPVLDGKHLAKARQKFQDKMTAFAKAETARKIAAAKIEKEAAFQRSFTVASFGIYNCDRYSSRQDVVRIPAEMTYLDDEFIAAANNVKIYLIEGENRTVVSYPYGLNNFCFDPKLENRMIAVLPGVNKVGVITAGEFRKLQEQDGAFRATFKPFPQNVESLDDLKSLINEI
ncbi:MAG: hypothetical protein FD123_338 [Bacteroidetes bacterium]|nr:MAG: hypothetical protein FD123_338 [Bacteroidota bacterium]